MAALRPGTISLISASGTSITTLIGWLKSGTEKIFCRSLTVAPSSMVPGRRRPGTIEEGATVRERQKIFSVPDLSQPMSVVIEVPEAEIKLMVPGRKAAISVDAFPDQTFTGRISQVSPLPSVQTA